MSLQALVSAVQASLKRLRAASVGLGQLGIGRVLIENRENQVSLLFRKLLQGGNDRRTQGDVVEFIVSVWTSVFGVEVLILLLKDIKRVGARPSILLSAIVNKAVENDLLEPSLGRLSIAFRIIGAEGSKK